ncbi:lipid-A-disaccharide synthase [Moraxella marmotae]|uniref:lipid-A-disaccharide synthase n=1 Tax=Moraxella marmotae TaxID=3344520 RepID=UPI0035F3AF54
MSNERTITIGIVAGEISGDALGGDFMQKMNAVYPNIRWVGVGGQAMTKQGLTSLIDMSRLSVMGLLEVVKHLPDLLRAKKQILSELLNQNIDIFVGIDAPDFNLRLSKSLKNQGIFCVQYVSPSIWAWRENRIHHIKAATDLVLCLFPFELDVYKKHNHPAVCVGHPLLNQLHGDERDHAVRLRELLDSQPNNDKLACLSNAQHKICLMAGSRNTEIHAILPLLLDSAEQICQTLPACQFILPVVSDAHADLVKQLISQKQPELLNKIHILSADNNALTAQTNPANKPPSLSHLCMNVSDVVLLASGTATLECLLLERPMVVVYKVNRLTFAIAKQLVKIPYVSLPNILSHQQTGQAIVPELIQQDATACRVSQAALAILDNPNAQIDKLTQTNKALRASSQHNPAHAVLNAYLADETENE